MKILIDITRDVLNNIAYFVKNNLMNIASFLTNISPYVALFIGQNAALKTGKIHVGPEIAILIFLSIVTFYLKSIANKIGKGITIPIPVKRFTEVDDDGEVSIEHARIQELLLYVADLEDWLERKGLM